MSRTHGHESSCISLTPICDGVRACERGIFAGCALRNIASFSEWRPTVIDCTTVNRPCLFGRRPKSHAQLTGRTGGPANFTPPRLGYSRKALLWAKSFRVICPAQTKMAQARKRHG